jgi:hypothetical protein
MKYTMRRIIQLLALSLLLPFWPAGDANAVFESALRGDYDLSATRFCSLESPNTVNVSQPTNTFEIDIQGRARFNGSGGVDDFTGQIIIPGNGNAGNGIPSTSGNEIKVILADITSCPGGYSVNTDGTFTATLNCNLAFTGAQNNLDIATLTNLKLRGKLALDGTVLVLANTVAGTGDIEVLDCPACDGPGGPNTGFLQRRICSTSGVATARR